MALAFLACPRTYISACFVAGGQRAGFLEVRSRLGHELTARINLLPIGAPDSSLETNIKKIENKRTKHEGAIFEQARLEMAGLTKVVQNEVEAQLANHASGLARALKSGRGLSRAPFRPPAKAIEFLRAEQLVLASGPALSTNVRVTASDEPFRTVASMVEGLERRRDASEDAIRNMLLEMELKLLEAENALVSSKVGAWVEHLRQTK